MSTKLKVWLGLAGIFATSIFLSKLTERGEDPAGIFAVLLVIIAGGACWYKCDIDEKKRKISEQEESILRLEKSSEAQMQEMKDKLFHEKAVRISQLRGEAQEQATNKLFEEVFEGEVQNLMRQGMTREQAEREYDEMFEQFIKDNNKT